MCVVDAIPAATISAVRRDELPRLESGHCSASETTNDEQSPKLVQRSLGECPAFLRAFFLPPG